MKTIISSMPTQRIAKMLLIIIAGSGIAVFFSSCYGAAYRHNARVENRVDRREARRNYYY
jgi:hypothetical protein